MTQATFYYRYFVDKYKTPNYTCNNIRANVNAVFLFIKTSQFSFIWVLENTESPGIPGLSSPGKRPLALESSGNLLNPTKKVYGRQ